MINNVIPRELLRGLARVRARDYETKTVHPTLEAEAISDGWNPQKRNRRSVRLARPKTPLILFRDRIWTLLYKTGLSCLSGAEGATLSQSSRDVAQGPTQIAIVGIDDELGLSIDCWANERYGPSENLSQLIDRHASVRERFASAINKFNPQPERRQAALSLFLKNVALTDSDRSLAKARHILLFDEHDLTYYESLVSHLGPAAKYQLFADMLPGKAIPGLTLRVPAIRTRMGGTVCYTFSISPSYLLKISYVSHRSKGKASDVHTYQRMLSRQRLNKIRAYISNDGVFPTNIVVNLESGRARFERIQQEDQDNGTLGWLDIRPAYKSAWIIDGQHRLFAYSGHELAEKSRLAVLAFEGLPPSKQAGLFIDINAKQKSVKQSLLQELYAELHWDAEEPETRVRAIISKAIQVLDSDPLSALFQRIQSADAVKSETRCITLTSLYGALEKTEFHIVREKKGKVTEFGPFWAEENEATLNRTVALLKGWFGIIRSRVSDWWDKGAGEGGGLAMNDGVTTCVNILRSVIQIEREEHPDLASFNTDDLIKLFEPYADALGEYFESLSKEGRRAFRDLRGVQGQTRRTRVCQQAMRSRIAAFNPAGLDQFLLEEKAPTNSRAKEIIDSIETTLQRVVLDELKTECGEDESQWWIVGVPQSVRLKVTQRFEQDDGKRGGKEFYFDLIDYRNVATANWGVFESLLGFGGSGRNKEKRTEWLAFVNEKRKVVAHVSAGRSITVEELARLQEYKTLLSEHVEGSVSESKPTDEI